MCPHELSPSPATVIGTEDAAVIVVEQSPGSCIQNRRVGGVKDDVVENIIVAGAEVGKNRPRIFSVSSVCRTACLWLSR